MSVDVKLSDLNSKQLARVQYNVEAMLTPLDNGCLVPKSPYNLLVHISQDVSAVHVRRMVWMLRYGETPPGRLRATCRTSGCCNADHLVLSDRLTRVEPQRTPGPRQRTTPEQQRQAYAMSLDPSNRHIDIAIALGIPEHRVCDALRRERDVQLRARELERRARNARKGQLVYPHPDLCGRS